MGTADHIPDPQHDTVAPLVASACDEDPQRLRERFARWGYLYFPGAVASADCRELLAELINAQDGHVVAGDDGLPQLAGAPFCEADAIWDAVYPQMQAVEAFHRFFHRERLQQLMRRVAGTDTFTYPMKMARVSTPRRIGHETPPHQDAYSHHAPPTMSGIWVALHPVDRELGRLQLLPGSHAGGVRPVHQALGVGGVQCEIRADETLWHCSDVGTGDVIIFAACTVHRAEPNRSEARVRISVDTRFCHYGDPVFHTNLDPHHGWRIDGLDWASVYAGWQQQDLKYYWHDYPHTF